MPGQMPRFFLIRMKRRGFFRVLIWFFSIAFIVLIGWLTYSYFTIKAPVQEITDARVKLAEAKLQLKNEFVNEEFLKAEKLYLKAMEEWQTQNNIFFPFRDYTNTKDFALRSAHASSKAFSEASNHKKNVQSKIENDFLKGRELIAKYDKYYKNLPLRQNIHDKFSLGKIKFSEARKNYEKKEYKKASETLAVSLENLKSADKAANFKLQEFFEGYPEWEKNFKLAYSLSKKGQTVVLVNKLESSFSILKSGKEVYSFPAEFGTNWFGDKMKAGDKATPEGVYKILEKKQGAKTKYYKALLLDYPNKADKQRFDKLKKAGIISNNASIGGLIEIHGEGEKGINWTEGCIALSNKNMDLVYKQCSVNTPVIIIGSTKTLENYLNSE